MSNLGEALQPESSNRQKSEHLRNWRLGRKRLIVTSGNELEGILTLNRVVGANQETMDG